MSRSDDYAGEFAAPRTSGKAITSLVLGLLSFCIPCLPALPAVLLGFLGLRDIGRSRGKLSGKGLAIAGIVTSIVGNLFLVGVGAVSLLPYSVFRVRQAAMQISSKNNLKNIWLALDDYQSDHGTYPPPAKLGPGGKPLLSWRVLILPQLGEGALYNQFHLDEPWDSPHNKALLPRMPKVYASPARSPGTELDVTYYQVFVGKGTVFEGPQGLRRTSIRDGVSNTILVVEAGDPVPWTKPEDLRYSPNQPLPRLGGMFKGRFNILFADGTVLLARTDNDEKVLRALITCNDGLPYTPNDLRTP